MKIITISREFGSGGRTIAKEVANQLGIAFYDKELIKKTAQKSGFAPSFIEENDEYNQTKWNFANNTQFSHAMGGMSANDYLYVMQCSVILELAKKNPV
jgi:cytidylate kinase